MTESIFHRSHARHFEIENAPMHALVSWRSILAGIMVSFFMMALLLSLGMAFGGLGLSDATDMQNAGIFTGVWFLISSVISIFTGSYFASRVSKFQTGRIGAAQGTVIASLFFGFFLFQTVSTIGWLGRTTGAVAGGSFAAIGAGAGQSIQNPVVNDMIENSLGDMNLKTEPKTVVSGVASRMIRGDTESAKNYLAYQAGITPQEADQRIAQLRAQIDQAMTQARIAAAKALQTAGWSLFATMTLGAIAAMVGGALGAYSNAHRPLVRERVSEATEFHAAPI